MDQTALKRRAQRVLEADTHGADLLPIRVGRFHIQSPPLRCTRCGHELSFTRSRARVVVHTGNSLALDWLPECACGHRLHRLEYLALDDRVELALIDAQGRVTRHELGRPMPPRPRYWLRFETRRLARMVWQLSLTLFGGITVGIASMLEPMRERLGPGFAPTLFLGVGFVIAALTLAGPAGPL